MAIAVVIGAAFGTVVKALVADLLTPLIAATVGDFANAVISFVVIALVVYFFVVLPVNKLLAQLKRGDAPPPDPTTKNCPECMSSIPITARKCAFCTSDLPAGTKPVPA